MQMYEVAFQTHYVNLIDIGKVVICADNQDQAVDLTTASLNLPRSKTTYKVQRIKPSIFQIDRREVPVEAEKKKTTANYERGSPLFSIFNCSISATISGRNEEHALRRLANSLVERSASSKAMIDRHTRNLVVECNLVTNQRELKSMEAVELYQPKHFIGGSQKYAKGNHR